MSKIIVKKGGLSEAEVPAEAKLNLRDKPVEIKEAKRGWLCAVGILAAVVLVLVFWMLRERSAAAFADLAPEQAVIFSVINQEALYEQTLPFQGIIKEQNLYIQPAFSKLRAYLTATGLNLEDDLQPHFKQKLAFTLMPSNGDTAFPFAVILERKNSLTDVSAILQQFKQELQSDFDLSSRDYRQMEITVLKPLFQAALFPRAYAYAQVEKYLVITNSTLVLEEIIDVIVDK